MQTVSRKQPCKAAYALGITTTVAFLSATPLDRRRSRCRPHVRVPLAWKNTAAITSIRVSPKIERGIATTQAVTYCNSPSARSSSPPSLLRGPSSSSSSSSSPSSSSLAAKYPAPSPCKVVCQHKLSNSSRQHEAGVRDRERTGRTSTVGKFHFMVDK